MKFPIRHIAAAACLAGLSLAASAQTPPQAPPGGPMMQRGPGGPGPGMDRMQHMQERMAHRMARLKEALRITPQQEGAWTAWTSAMRPAQGMQRPDIGEMARLATPERIERMKQLRSQRIAEQDRRGEATKVFYNALTAEQKRVFDQLTLKRFEGGMGGGMHGRMHGGMHGGGPGHGGPGPR